MTKTNLTIAGVAVLVVGFILGSLGAKQAAAPTPQAFAGTAYDLTNASGGLRVGQNGTNVGNVQIGTCTLSTTVGNLPLATSSKPFDCPAPGVRSGDLVFGDLASDGGSLGGTTGVQLSYVKASTTANYVQVWLRRPFAGADVATSSFALATTSFEYYAVRRQ